VASCAAAGTGGPRDRPGRGPARREAALRRPDMASAHRLRAAAMVTPLQAGKYTMTCSRLVRWTAVLVLVIAPVAAPVMAAEDDTITITGTFTSDSGEHTWTLAMYGTTFWHHLSNGYYFTEVSATSFDLQFSGPDADALNAVASEQLAGGTISLELRNVYQALGGDWSTMALWIWSPDASTSFWAGHELVPNAGLFPSDADGYPIVTAEPFAFWNEETYLSWYGFFQADADGLPNAEISGGMGSPVPAPLPTLSIADASVAEGDRGRTTLKFSVSRSGPGDGTVSVDYRTVAGTARPKSDYNAASGTLTFQPGVYTQTISITVKTDRTREPDETFTVELLGAVGATIGDGVATGTILNDD